MSSSQTLFVITWRDVCREVLPDVLEALRQQPCAVLQAPPGAGKTTTVPLAMLLQEPHYLQPQQKILVGWKHAFL